MSALTGYPLDLYTPAKHIRTEMEDVAPAASSISEMADSYFVPIQADLIRVKDQEGCRTDAEGKLWIITKVLGEWVRLNKVVVDGDKAILADGVTFDDLRWNRTKVTRLAPPSAFINGEDPFNKTAIGPLSEVDGRPLNYAENLRRKLGDLTELRESLRAFGWLDHHPAIRDENGVVLVGHRRIAAAELEDVEPRFVTVNCGHGDEGDAQRFRLAIGSNMGGKPLGIPDRVRLAMYLYNDKGWDQAQVAEALAVSTSTVSEDLKSRSTMPGPGADDLEKVRLQPPPATPEQALEIQARVDGGEPGGLVTGEVLGITNKRTARTKAIRVLDYAAGYSDGYADCEAGRTRRSG